MSATPKLTKKQKKALAFRERKGKGKAKSFDDLDNDIPVEENQDIAEAEGDEPGPSPERLSTLTEGEVEDGGKHSEEVNSEQKGKGKKRKRVEGDDEPSAAIGEEVSKGKAKKKQKGEDGEGVAVTEGAGKGEEKKGKQRFILFVGNLKYTTTKEAIEAHFSKCDPPPTIRLITPKPTANSKPTVKSKGCAFVEFSHRNALQQGLKLHQSELDGRKINVELTAGGGGKGERRLEKVKQRNKELHDQRKKQVTKRPSGKKAEGSGDPEVEGDVQMERPQRYSATSGVDQIPLKKRTWSIPEEDEGAPTKVRGSKKGKKRPPKALGTGVNAIPVG